VYNLQTDSAEYSVSVNLENKVAEHEVVPQNAPKTPVTAATHTNSQNPIKYSQDPSKSSEKEFIPSQCPTVAHKKSPFSFPTVTFKHVLNPPENIQQYYKTTSDEMNQVKFFTCDRITVIGFASSSDRLAYHCHSDDMPVQLLVEVPKAAQVGQTIVVELDTAYSAMALNTANGRYDGILEASFVQDLKKPCSYGVTVVRPWCFAKRFIYLSDSVPDSKSVCYHAFGNVMRVLCFRCLHPTLIVGAETK
jgi:hypothetical protein